MSEFREVSEYLPDVVHQMINAVGFHDVEKIINKFGGTSFRFSDGEHYFPKLIEVIGEKSAVTLREYFCAEIVYIPRCIVALRMLRNQQLKADFDYLTSEEKKSGRLAMLEICPKYKISNRQAWEIINSFRRENKIKQHALF
ncbi:TPA: mor transcription activator family protein [Pasteurella multocida]|nr:mor transcription activator family protein [Pasteurella multocida]